MVHFYTVLQTFVNWHGRVLPLKSILLDDCIPKMTLGILCILSKTGVMEHE